MSASAVTTVSRAIEDALAAARADRSARAAKGALAVAVGLSGGRDSIVLLDALAAAAPACDVSLSAVHVHHGLSPHADLWAEFCATACGARGVALSVHRVRVDRAGGTGTEAAARGARYAAFETVAADFVALAHHADDQAETLLLQLLRGAGPHGLAAMPVVRPLNARVALLRPLLALPAAMLAAYARARALEWIDDDSNADTSLRRNFLRREIVPRLRAAFPGYPATLARAAFLQAEAASLLDEVAALDARAAAAAGDALDRRAFAALAARAPPRARNVLRGFLRQHGLRAPSAARLDAMLRQLGDAAPDARVRLLHDGAEIGIHRNRILVHGAAIVPFVAPWRGEPTLELPHGKLEFAAVTGKGLAVAAVERSPVVVRPRAGGERIRIAADRPRQTLKRLLQAAGIPEWQRNTLPLVWCGGALAAVPGIGVDAQFAAAPGERGLDVRWHPTSAAPPRAKD
ncbi:MAG TPA: tRNA lysidine(34) synthetase TilS [Casimicrobiaceae bacterium]|nr:tRNA lysidine(34) synthetase TilS [Casimicrobiaceae bacterium]